MSFFGKLYVHERDENFEEFLRSLGITQEIIANALKSKPTHKITKDGDTYTMVTGNSPIAGELKFKDGVSFDETLPGNVKATSKITVDGNVFTQVHTAPDGRNFTIIRKHYDDKLVVTLSDTMWDGTATRYYKVA